MISRPIFRARDKYFIAFIILLCFLTVLYLYLNYLQQEKSVHLSGERCLSELTSVKYQLNVVTEYKNRIDKLLTETQKANELDKERFKEIMESCAAMKHQASICQNQFEDLQGECKKVREDYNELLKEMKKT
ncbi:uncharacterized protein LOC106130629 [Amyelois transitella]|uniref:uncharacterized protein LOC106130629 n=1 Tax=Amyelois transitella TaxID=680683 RepID=UPI00067C594D|nr:uncharacterized protein LOC106130629 [Amyelois transitella]